MPMLQHHSAVQIQLIILPLLELHLTLISASSTHISYNEDYWESQLSRIARVEWPGRIEK
jgi:hypothetical protein